MNHDLGERSVSSIAGLRTNPKNEVIFHTDEKIERLRSETIKIITRKQPGMRSYRDCRQLNMYRR